MKQLLVRSFFSLLIVLLIPSVAFGVPLESANYILDEVNFATNSVITSSKDGIPPVISSQGPRVTALTPTSAVIVWETDKKSTSKVEYGTSTKYELNTGSNDTVTEHSIRLAGLTPETRYHFRVVSEDAYGSSSNSVDYTFETPAPTQFQEVSVSQITYTTALIKVVAGGLRSVKVTYGTSRTGGLSKQAATVAGTAENNFPLEDLTPGTKYYLTIEGTDDKGAITTLEGLTFMTVAEPRINLMTGTALSPNEIQVEVETITPTTVIVTYKSDKDEDNLSVGDTTLDTIHSLKLLKLFGQTEYTITANITDAGGKRLTSDQIRVTTLTDTSAPEPSDPSVNISKVGDKISVTARWESNEPIRSSITITSKTNPNDVIRVSGPSGFSINQVIQASNLAAKTPYVLSAISTDNAGNVSERSISFVTPSVNKSIFELILQNLSRLIDPIAKLIKNL